MKVTLLAKIDSSSTMREVTVTAMHDKIYFRSQDSGQSKDKDLNSEESLPLCSMNSNPASFESDMCARLCR